MALRLGLGLGLSGGVSFSPLSLFAASEPGFWFDPSDLTTLFQDAAGTTPVTAAGQSVGLVLDKSGRGNHATQSTSLSRPTLGRNPVGGTRNLLTYTEQFDNAAWSKVRATVAANAITAPDGTGTADQLAGTAVAGTHCAIQIITKAASALIYSALVYVKQAQLTKGELRFSDQAGNGVRCTFDLAAGTVATAVAYGTGFTVGASAITALPNGWYRVSLSGTTNTATTLGHEVYLADASGNVSYTGDGTSGIFVWGAQLETGSTATAYQKVVSAFDVTEAGKADYWYLGFDGSDDFLVTPTITPGTDKVQVFAGVTKLSDAARRTVVELTASTATNNGSFHLAAPNAASATIAFESKGTALTDAIASSGVTAPVTAVVTGIADIGADTNIIRINGAQADSDGGDQGTGNFTAAAVYIGRRGGTSQPLNGRIYSLICRFGPNLTADQIAQTEAWVNARTGAY